MLGAGQHVQLGVVVSGRIAGLTSASVPSLRELWPYAETPLRRTRQIVGDVAVLIWCVLWWTTAAWAARRLRCTREGLQGLGVRAAATAPLGAVGGALHPHAGGGGMDQHTLEVLGSLELDRLGLRRPPRS